jgi:glycosyltransferase involved in cell wall biosynthesis
VDDVAAAEAEETGLPPGRFWLYPANLWPHKRHALLLHALAHARQRGHDVRLVLTGHPDGLEALQAQAQALGLPDHALQHCGYVSDARLHALYRRADALVFASSYEGCGMPLLEAMHAGCPVICAPCAAIPEIVGEAALLVQPDDSPQAWASAALDVLPERRQALIAAGRAHAQPFTWQAARAAWRTLLLEAGLHEDPAAPPDAPPDQSAALSTLRMGGLESGRMRRLVGTPWLWRAQRMMLAQAAVYAGRQPPA